MKYIIAAIVLISFPAFSDEYYHGYDEGYYNGGHTLDHTSSYGRGVDDGSYDAYQEDMRRANQEVEDSRARTEESYKILDDRLVQSKGNLQASIDNINAQAAAFYAENPQYK